MPNLAKTLNDEIRRLARKEVKTALADTQQRTASLKKTVSALKQQVAKLERENKRLAAGLGRAQTTQPASTGEGAETSARITAKGIRSLRRKWGFTREQFAAVLAVSPQSVFQWERKDGPLRLRTKAKEAYLQVRDWGAREAREHLASRKKSSRKRRARK